MTTLHLIRHPQSQANLRKQLNVYDAPLSAEGIQQAQHWAKQHAHEFDDTWLVANTQERCSLLYELLQQHNHLAGRYRDARFNERNFYAYTGATKHELLMTLQKNFPDRFEVLGTNFSGRLDEELSDPAGNPYFETNTQLKLRIMEALSDLSRHAGTRDCVLITSTGVIRTLHAHFLNKDARSYDHYLLNTLGRNSIPNLHHFTIKCEE